MSETVQFQRMAVAAPDKIANSRTIRRLRHEAGMTQRALADALGISAPYLCDIEQGQRGITEEMFNRAKAAINAYKSNHKPVQACRGGHRKTQ
jgi:predicted transcriptional regulator